jgi:hypothetical protein
MANWTKPAQNEHAPYYKKYIDKVDGENIPQILKNNFAETLMFLNSISKDKLQYRYAEGKWTIPQIVVHLTDTERVFSYRAMCIARGDKTPLPGFDENLYADACNYADRSFESIVAEFSAVRQATILLLESFDDTCIEQIGTASEFPVSVRAIAFMIGGHELHHISIIKERYL